ncbi:MAG: DUF2809 domain-containing protein [Microbacterium enclense]
MTVRHRRVAALAALIVVIAAGLIVARALPDSIATDIAGDALYAVATYAGLVLVWPRGHRVVLAAVAATWCVVVELLQLSGIPATLAERFPPAALVLGTGFDPRDLLVYLLAVASAVWLDARVSALLLHGGERPPGVGGPE